MSESKKAFEAWAKLAFPHMSLLKKGDTDKYVYKTANFACEAFCEGEAWQASRQEGEPIGYVVPRMLEAMQAGKYCGISISDEQKAGDIAGYTHPASAAKQAVSVPKQWVDLMCELVKDLISEIKTKQKLKPDERVAEDLGAVREAIALIAKQEKGE